MLGLGFVWDDVGLYLSVPALRDFSSFWAGTVATVHPGLHFFRPVALLTFKAQFLLFGPSPVAAHAIGLGLHTVNTFLVALLAARIIGASGVRVALAGLLYGLHPALIEPVSWMSCRFDLLVTVWLLLALLADLGLRHAVARAGAIGLLFLLALNSKEMAAPFPAVLALFQWATRYRATPWPEVGRQWLRGEAWTYAALLIVAAGYVLLRNAFIGATVDTDPDIVAELVGLPERAAFFASTVLFHLRMVVLPFDALNPLHPVDLASLAFTGRDVAALAGVALLLAALAAGVVRRSRSLVLLAAALLALFPVLNAVPLSIARNIGHERYLTFPLSLVALAIALAPFPPAPPLRRAALAGGALAGLGWLILAVANIRLTVPLWQSDVSLWSWALARNPESEYARYSLLTSLLRVERPDLAAPLVAPPVTPNAYRALTQFELAKYLIRRGETADGERHLREALQRFPPWHAEGPADGRAQREFATHRGNIGIAYTALAELELDAGRHAAARDAVALAEFYYPGYAPALLASALALYGLDEAGRARELAALALARSADRAAATRRLDEFLDALCAAPRAARTPHSCRAPRRWSAP